MKIDLFDYAIKANKNNAVAKNSAPEADVVKPFGQYLSESMTEVNKLQKESDSLIERLATGDVDDISEVVMASSRAEVAIKMLMEVRNKLLEAYQQISRIQG